MILSVCIVANHWSWNLLSFDAFPLVPHLGNNWLSVGRISGVFYWPLFQPYWPVSHSLLADCDLSISKFSLASLRFRMADSGDRLNAVPGWNPERVLFQFVGTPRLSSCFQNIYQAYKNSLDLISRMRGYSTGLQVRPDSLWVDVNPTY
jgi:hypothetical protein